MTIALAGGIFDGLNCSVIFDSGAGRERAYAVRSGGDARSAYSPPETCCRFDNSEPGTPDCEIIPNYRPLAFDGMSNDRMDGEFGL